MKINTLSNKDGKSVSFTDYELSKLVRLIDRFSVYEVLDDADFNLYEDIIDKLKLIINE
jgi:hypothetical protein